MIFQVHGSGVHGSRFTVGEFRFLRYAKRSCTDAQSEIYAASDEKDISTDEFKDTYEQFRRITQMPDCRS